MEIQNTQPSSFQIVGDVTKLHHVGHSKLRSYRGRPFHGSVKRVFERRELSKIYLRMARKFGCGELTLGNSRQLDEDGTLLEKRYRIMAAQARRSAILLRRVAQQNHN